MSGDNKEQYFVNRPGVIDVDGMMWRFVEERNDWERIPGQPVAFSKIASIISPATDGNGYTYYVGAVGVDGRYYQQSTEIRDGKITAIGAWIQLPTGPVPGSGFWFVD